MAENSLIEWTDATFNPWIGCMKVSPACDNCYAEVSAPARVHKVMWGAQGERKRTSMGNWSQPRRWDRQHPAFSMGLGRRRRVFCASLADVFDNQVPDEWREDLWKLIAETPNLDWLILTKRVGNVNRWALRHGWPANAWLGISVCNQEEADRDIPKLLATPAPVKFLSMEPLLGSVDLTKLAQPDGTTINAFQGYVEARCGHQEQVPGVDWVIVGGESGRNARMMHPYWAEEIAAQCEAAGVPFMFKQWGEWMPISEMADGESDQYYAAHDPENPDASRECLVETSAIGYGGAVGFDEAFWVVRDRAGVQRGGMQMFKVGKKAAGRRLRGRLHGGFPLQLTHRRGHGPVRVWRINDMEWWASTALDAACVLGEYLWHTGVTHEEATGDEDTMPVLLTDEQMGPAWRHALDEMIETRRTPPWIFAVSE